MSSHDDGGGGRYGVVMIGAGPAGKAAAGLGGNLGYPVALVERDTVGGTVVTSGGAPTKAFREAAAYLSGFEKEKAYGVALSAPPEVMYPAITARARRVSEQLRQATLERIRERGVHLVRGQARLDGEHTVVARAADGAETWLHAGRVIIATGASPLRPAGPAFGMTPVTPGAATSTCGSGRSPSAAREARTGSSGSATRPPGAWTGTSAPAPATRRRTSRSCGSGPRWPGGC